MSAATITQMTPAILKALTEALNYEIKWNEKKVLKFQDYMSKDAFDALESSREVFEAAAKIRVLNNALLIINETHVLDDIVKFFQDETTRSTQYPVFSTSPTTNLMAMYKGKALAEVTELIRSYTKE